MIVRLIDICLIVLFGFITISDIDIKGALSLPSKKAKKIRPQDKREKVILTLEVHNNNVFWVSRPGQRRIRKDGIFSLETYLKDLKAYLSRTEKSDLCVYIKPLEMSPLQSTIDVLDLCDRNRIPKNIARKSMAMF